MMSSGLDLDSGSGNAKFVVLGAIVLAFGVGGYLALGHGSPSTEESKGVAAAVPTRPRNFTTNIARCARSEEHTSELQSLMRISYAVFCLKKKKKNKNNRQATTIIKQPYK